MPHRHVAYGRTSNENSTFGEWYKFYSSVDFDKGHQLLCFMSSKLLIFFPLLVQLTQKERGNATVSDVDEKKLRKRVEKKTVYYILST